MRIFTLRLRTVFFAAVMVAGAVCASYGDNPSILVGRWESITRGWTDDIELFQDGKFAIGASQNLTWKIENNRFVTSLGPTVLLSSKYRLSGHILTLVSEDDTTRFVRKEYAEEYKKKKAEEKQKEAERIKIETERRLEKISTYFTDSRTGQKYRAVKIGGKTWMAENLNYQTGNSWCYENDESKCKQYGRLYDWNTARTACPKGWHLPSRDEWNALTKAVRGDANALMSVTGWKLDEETEDGANDVVAEVGTDKYGFTALPGGQRYPDGKYISVYETGFWWTATAWYESDACIRYINSGGGSVGDFDGDEAAADMGSTNLGFSVRCVQN